MSLEKAHIIAMNVFMMNISGKLKTHLLWRKENTKKVAWDGVQQQPPPAFSFTGLLLEIFTPATIKDEVTGRTLHLDCRDIVMCDIMTNHTQADVKQRNLTR